MNDQLDTEELKRRCLETAKQLDLKEVHDQLESETGVTYSGFIDNNGIKQHWGELKLPDGSLYEGEWKDGKRSGLGKQHRADLRLVYEG